MKNETNIHFHMRVFSLVRQRWLTISLCAIAAVAVALCAYGLDLQYVSRDECFSWRLIQYPLVEQVRRTAADVHPPLYYLLLWAWSTCVGVSMFSLRTMSVILSVAAVGVTYLATHRSTTSVKGRFSRPEQVSASLFAAALMAVHVVQVDAGRNARMYSLGVLMAATSPWLLLAAIGREKENLRWWAGYGVAAAAFCYTHYFAFFTILAQGTYVLAMMVGAGASKRWADLGRHARGVGISIVVAATLYCVWLPTLFAQVTEVREAYWIPKPSWHEVRQNLYWWWTGIEGPSAIEWWVWVALLTVVAAMTLYRARSIALFWILQAVTPWAISIAISCLGKTPILQERYLVFSHVGAVAFLGIGVASMPKLPGKLLAGWFVMATCVIGTWEKVAQITNEPAAVESAMRFVKKQHQFGDTILVDWHGEVNRVRYYAWMVGIREADVRYVSNGGTGRGHRVHVASFDGDDVLIRSGIDRIRRRRWWNVGHTQNLHIPLASECLMRRTFEGPGDYTSWTAGLYVTGEADDASEGVTRGRMVSHVDDDPSDILFSAAPKGVALTDK